MSDSITIPLVGPDERDLACNKVRIAPKGHVVTIRPAKRSLDQSAKFHAICGDLAKAGAEWPPTMSSRSPGRARTADEWKFLLVSAHAVATKIPGELLLGLEGERVMLRPSTAAMSVAEMTSLIEYCLAFCAQRGIAVRD